MDSTKVAVAGIAALVAVLAVMLGFRFLADHWEDIKSLVIVALVLGGTFSIAVGGLKLRSGR
jgi:uncharacterized membrane protein